MGKEIVGSHVLTFDPDRCRLCRACELALNILMAELCQRGKM